jgi:hypothetical protein
METYIWDSAVHPEEQYNTMDEQAKVRSNGLLALFHVLAKLCVPCAVADGAIPLSRLKAVCMSVVFLCPSIFFVLPAGRLCKKRRFRIGASNEA